MEMAFHSKLESVLEDGPVMASVHYTFDPQNPIPSCGGKWSVDGRSTIMTG